VISGRQSRRVGARLPDASWDRPQRGSRRVGWATQPSGCQVFGSCHATCAYSWISPPSRSRRATLPAGGMTSGSAAPSGGPAPRPGAGGGGCNGPCTRSAVKRSSANTPLAWVRRNCRQVSADRLGAGSTPARRRMTQTVLAPILQGQCGRDRIRTCIGEAGGFTGRTAVASRVPSHPHLAPIIKGDVHKRPADSFCRRARPGVGRREVEGKSRPAVF
jgi:hypothetical protein